MSRALRTAAIAIAALALPASAATAATPSLRLFAADGSVSVNRDELSAGSLHFGLWVAATDGAFQIHAQRPGYGRWQAAQVDAVTGAQLRAVPARLVDGASGLTRFLDVRVLTRSGRRVARRTIGFCPGTFERVSADGPPNATYAYGGGCGPGFPFVRGVVWGIDQGWATSVGGGFEFGGGGVRPLRLRAGRYRVVAAIAPAYRQLFEIPADRAEARLQLRVTPGFRRARGRAMPEREFAPGLPAAATAAAALDPAGALGPPTVTAPDPATMPDLVALPPWDVGVHRARRNGRELLRFAGTPWNAGPAPLVVEGFRQSGRPTMDASQSFVDREGNVVGSAPAGKMEFHAARSHNHWHFLQFVSYRLLRPGGKAVRARKQSFCLASTDAVDLTVSGARYMPDAIGFTGSACGDDRSIWMRETLPAGWGDTYGAGTAGQSFDVTGLPNGAYVLEMRVNPLGQLHETTTDNNVARRRVVLRGKRGKRRVQVAAWHGIRR
jgi:Lysyl oxidase